MSKRVRFTDDYDHQVRPNSLVAYKAGQELSVPDPHAEAAIAAGKAQLVPGAKQPGQPAPATPDAP